MRSLDRPTRPRCTWLLALTAVVLLAGAAPDDEKPLKVGAAPEAKDHVGERCMVEMTVRSSKNAAPRREYYLDSEEDFHDPKNLGVVITKAGRPLQGEEAASHRDGDPRERPDSDAGREARTDQGSRRGEVGPGDSGGSVR